LDTQSLEDTHLVKLDTNVQRTLSSEGEEDTIRSLLLEHVGDVVGSDGEEVNLGGKVVGCLDGSDVGVDEDGVDVALSESFDSLGTWRVSS
jgi:hypothetical protein